MSKIDDVQRSVQSYFNHLSGPSYVRILDTPHVWGQPFGKEIMPGALARQAEFERAIVEIVQKSRYRCDLASLNSPDPDWVRPILGAMDTALTKTMGRTQPTQFRFLFGQTPLSLYPDHLFNEPVNYTDFKAALIRLVRVRSQFWERMPEIWMGRFYRLEEGILSTLKTKVFGDNIISSDDTKMTWNHAKIIVVDGTEALVGGHNLNMDLFASYPPVHDVSVVVHGEAAHGSQLFLNKMWECGTDLLTKEYLEAGRLAWVNGDRDRAKPTDPLSEPGAAAYMNDSQRTIVHMHAAGMQEEVDDAPIGGDRVEPEGMRAQDLQTLLDLQQEVFQERITYKTYDKFQDYKLATRMLSVGKYWNGPNLETDYQKASEVMKEQLIRNAKSSIRMSQMDLISAWKKNWSDHVVCHWLMAALLANKNLRVQVVVSPLDAGAGAEGDQYSFGSGAARTFDLIKYYMTHDANTDAPLDDGDGARADALKRLQVAPFYFTDRVPDSQTVEGKTYKWPNLSPEGYTATLKQPPLSEAPPSHGVIGSAAWAVLNASGKWNDKVPSAPGNHAKIMIVDDELYVVGSDNLYPGSLSEFNYLVEGQDAVNELIKSYWGPLWQYAGPHSVTPTPLPDQAGRLLFYRDQNQNGTGNVANPSVIGLGGWQDFKFLLSGGNGIIYAVDQAGRLLFYRDQNQNGTGDVANPSVIGLGGWQDFKFLLSGGNGIIYAVDQAGRLLFYRDQNQNGTGDVANPSVIGLGGWQDFKFLLSGGNGIIYAVDQAGRLLFYRDQNQNGTGDVANPSVIGLGGWQDFKFLLSGGNGIIYAVDQAGRLLFYRDQNQNGTGDVANPSVIGLGGWQDFKFLFPGGNGIIYAVEA